MERKLSEIDFFQVYKNWKTDLGPFQCFVKATNFVSLKHYPDFTLSTIPGDTGGTCFDRIYTLLKEYDCKSTLFLLDINGTDAIKTAYHLRKLLSLAPVPVFNGVMHPYGLVGDKEYISCLIDYGLKNDKKDTKGYIFIFDSNRYGEYPDEQLKRFFNNQYELGDEDFPPVEMLGLLKYERAVCICDREKEDLAGYLEYLRASGISVDKVCL